MCVGGSFSFLLRESQSLTQEPPCQSLSVKRSVEVAVLGFPSQLMSLTTSVRTTLAEPCFGTGHILSLLCQPTSEDMTALQSLVTQSDRGVFVNDEIVAVTWQSLQCVCVSYVCVCVVLFSVAVHNRRRSVTDVIKCRH